jgi:hypothetical protein
MHLGAEVPPKNYLGEILLSDLAINFSRPASIQVCGSCEPQMASRQQGRIAEIATVAMTP